MLTLGLVDAFDENSNLLKLGTVRVRLEPALIPSRSFSQTLTLSNASVQIKTEDVRIDIWIDAESSDVRISIAPGSYPRKLVAMLDHWRLNGTINAA